MSLFTPSVCLSMSAWLCLHMTACLRVCVSACLPVCQSASLKGLFYFCLLSWDSTLIRTLPVNSRLGRKWLTIIMTLAYQNKEWNNTFLAFSLIIEGTTDKVLQFIMPLESIYSKKTLVSLNTNWFWTLQRGSNNKKYIIDFIFVVTIFFWWPFQNCPHRLILVLNKDVLFH